MGFLYFNTENFVYITIFVIAMIGKMCIEEVFQDRISAGLIKVSFTL
jgi:hypothetical protein